MCVGICSGLWLFGLAFYLSEVGERETKFFAVSECELSLTIAY